MELSEEPIVFYGCMDIVILDSRFIYNGIFGRSTSKQFKAVISVHHLCLKFETPKGIAVTKGDQNIKHEFYFGIQRKTTPRAPLVNTTMIVEGNMLENPLVGKQTLEAVKDWLKNLSANKTVSQIPEEAF